MSGPAQYRFRYTYRSELIRRVPLRAFYALGMQVRGRVGICALNGVGQPITESTAEIDNVSQPW
jgi:hypothetical protein